MATIQVTASETSQRRKTFFEFLFNRAEPGYLCLAKRKPSGQFEEEFFEWPKDIEAALVWIEKHVVNHNMWFCPMLFKQPRRSKFEVIECPAAWSDLDTCPPEVLRVPPTLLLETSQGRHQGLWVLEPVAEALEAEDLSKAIAYTHQDLGADKSGWDLTQLLRVPYTLNYKYEPPDMVSIVGANALVPMQTLREAYPPVVEGAEAAWPFPDEIPDPDSLLQVHRDRIPERAWLLLRVKPEKDWSKSLWQLEMLLCECGLTREQVFSITKTAACNKYQRDGRNDSMLWREVCKAWAKHHERNVIVEEAKDYQIPDLLTKEQEEEVAKDRTFIDDYVDWAKTVGDASEVYHHAGAFTALSALMSGSVQLPTSFGTIVPNLWFLLLADTTLTRKSTALDLVVDMLVEVDPSLIMATDGSIEGMFTALSIRPGQPSIFLRDEFSGLIEVMTKREYMAGMAESLTKMYDGKLQKRVLRREVIEVKDPILIIFAGGIKSKILSLLTQEQVTSGFLPRFIFVAGESDISKLRPLGPPVEKTQTGREELVQRMREYHAEFSRMTTIKMGDKELQTKNVRKARLTDGAWTLYNEMERKLLETGIASASVEMLTPVLDRLAKSGLKAAMLIAASRLGHDVIVEERDILKAFSYVTVWRGFAMDVVSAIGLPHQERQMQNIYNSILRHPGIMRSSIMQRYHLSKRDADAILDTMEQRGMINRTKHGRTESLTPVGSDDD